MSCPTCGHPLHTAGACPGAARACMCRTEVSAAAGALRGPTVTATILDDPPRPSRPRARARWSDPITSHEAAAAFRVSQLRASQYEIFRLFSLFGACHDEQLLERARQHGVRQSESGIRTRRHELVERGLLKDSGTTVTLAVSGRQSIVWMVARQNGQ